MIYISFDIGVKNLALCILNHADNRVTIIDWRVISLAESKKQFKGTELITNTIYAELDNIIGFCETIDIKYIDKIIIENQPSNLNGIMKTIQMLIFSYFSLLKHWDSKVGEVILINAIHKLQNHSYIPTTERPPKPDRQEKYKLNKQDSIEICKHYIKDDDNLVKLFSSNKKKDDLADTLLQTISYIRKNGHPIDKIFLSSSYTIS